jgi:hypothetical protein
VWISPWSRRDLVQPLRYSLVPNAITGGEDLIDDLVDEPTNTIVYSGYHPTHLLTPEISHHGVLADVLMPKKGFAND